jgi:hypothetical protein
MMRTLPTPIALLACTASVFGCASTKVSLTPSPQPPVCERTAAALVLWAPRWRPDQKDVPDREAAAERGLQDFLSTSNCFAKFELRRVAATSKEGLGVEVAASASQFSSAVVVTLRELGPILKIGSSPAIVDGGTEVVFDLAEYRLPGSTPARTFRVHWQHGGPGVVKGVSTLPSDMKAALTAAFQPSGERR